jgi:hypothetical protein
LQSLWNPEPYNGRRAQPQNVAVGCALLVTRRYALDLLAPLDERLDSVPDAADDSAEKLCANSGTGVPSWPDANHTTSTWHEFGLIGKLHGATVLMNYATHPAMMNDPTSTLERTIWLVS